MSRKVLIVAVVAAVLLSAMAVPASATPLEAGDDTSAQTGCWPGLDIGSLVCPMPVQLAGDGSCGGAGSCPS